MDCQKCGKTFSRADSKTRHENSCDPKKLNCSVCDKTFTKNVNKRRHEEICTGKKCKNCHFLFSNFYNLSRHEEYCGEPPAKKLKREPKISSLLSKAPDVEGVNEYETAFGNRLKSFFIRCNNNYDLNHFCLSIKDKIIQGVKQSLLIHGAVTFNISVDCLLDNTAGDLKEVTFKTKNQTVLKSSDLSEMIDKMFAKLDREYEETQLKKSSWRLKGIDGLRIKINKYIPLRGSSFLELPKKIRDKHACINVINSDQKCFMYAVLCKFVNEKPQRVSQYASLEGLYDFSVINYPTPLTDIKKFEKTNKISINVFGISPSNAVYPLKLVDEELEDHRDLLLLEKNGKSHYVYIADFEKLVRSQITKNHSKIIVCKRCLTHFYSSHQFNTHKELCYDNAPARIILPFKKRYVEFEHVEKAMRVPYVVYCDFESILSPFDTCKPNPYEQYSSNYQLHEPMSFCCYLKISNEVSHIKSNLPTEPYLYRGKDAAKHFMEYLKKLGTQISEIYDRRTPMTPLTEEEENSFKSAEKCYMCGKAFTDETKVRDHCHITGRYRGAAHQACNLRYQNPNFLPVLCHNLSNYDAHFIVRQLGYDDKEISVIPNSEEKYISFSKKINQNFSLRFLDTFRFMASSLDRLARNIPEYREITKFFPPEHTPLLTRKGVFPYDFVTSWEKLEFDHLPPKTDFYNKLTNSNISDDDYEHAKNVWNTFGFKTLGDYSDHYLKTDVLLLADVFESFRDITLKTHKLDPCNYFTLPGLSWDAMLRFTGVKLDLLLDYDKILMIEQGIRGGICQVSHRYLKANNTYLPDYNPLDNSSYITHQDCNNLYGHAMVQPLPIGEFSWVRPREVDLNQLTPEDEYGYILEVDVDYPEKLHDLHNTLPFLPENIKINNEVKLVPHLNSRKKYVVHYLTLIQALQHGLILRKVHRVLKFRQSRWLKPYIDHNTQLRTAASNDFEKDLYKLYNNSVFGKTMENVRKRLDIKLVSGSKRLEKLTARPDFIDRTIYDENLAAVHLAKKSIKLDKPLYIGLAVLDLSKIVMYSYHYDVMLPKYGPERLLLGYMDTDAFIYQVFTEDIYEDFQSMMEYLDTSDYPKDHPCYSVKNKKVLGKFKDEANGQIIRAFVGLRAKMYSVLFEQHETRKAKGVKKAVLKNNITFDDYVTCLRQNKETRHPMNFIRSAQHVITSPKWYCRSGEVWVLKGLVLPQWRRREVSLRHGYIIIHPGEGSGREERGKVCGSEEGAWPRAGRHVLKVGTPVRSIYLGMEEAWQRGLWTSWIAEEELRSEGDLSGLGLTQVDEASRHLKQRLDLSRNLLSGHLPELAAAKISVAENKLTSISPPRQAVSLDLSGNKIHLLPDAISQIPSLEELRLDRNMVTSLPAGPYRGLKVLSASQNKITELPPFLGAAGSRHLLDIEEDLEEKPENLESVNLRGNSLKGTIILGNYGNLTQLDVSENNIEALDLTALERLQNVQCSKNRLQELSVNGTSLQSLIAGNNCLTKLTVHPRPYKLRHLDISFNRLEGLPDWTSHCPQLKTLFASHNQLTSLPERLFSGENCIQTLQLSFNRLQDLPTPGKSLSVQQIFLQGNRLRTLPHQFFVATLRLRTLNLTKNRLEELPSTVPQGHQLERLYLTTNHLTHVDSLVNFPNLRLLHLSYNLVSQLPKHCVPAWPEMEELVVSGNRLDSLPAGLASWKHLRVLRLHCNLIQDPPALAASTSLKVLDLSHNNLERVNLTTLIPKQLQFLDISGNIRLQVDPRQFHDYKSQRAVSLVDTSGKGRSSLPASPQENMAGPSQWSLGFSETPGTRERLCISQLRLTGFCGNEALLGLFDSGTDPELPKILANSIPRILLEERTVKETANEYMKYTLLAAHRELKERGQRSGCCALVCHMCSERGSGLRKRTLRVATVGEAKAVLARSSSSLTLAHVPTQIIRSQVGNSSLYPLVVPDPHVTELSLRDDDRFLIMANKRMWEVVTAEEAANEVRQVTEPGLAAKRLQDLAQSYGCEDNLSVIVVSLQQTLPQSPTYRFQEKVDSCWCNVDRSSPSGQSDQASCGKTSSRDNFLHYIPEKKELEENRFEPVLMRENGTRKMTSRLPDGGHITECEESSSDRSGSGQMSDEQFRCWEYMLEQNTQLLFDKELGSISKAGLSPHQRKIFGGSTRSNGSCCPKTSAYFGSLSHPPPQFQAPREKSEADSLETEDRMSKYWDVATTEL